MELQDYYNEQASQARQHEDHRERMTNIILSINGVLVGFITFSNLSIWSLSASLSIIFLGIYGFLFSGKHYERFRYHNSIMGAIKKEMDRTHLNPALQRKTLRQIRKEGTSSHYHNFTWPIFRERKARHKSNNQQAESNNTQAVTNNQKTIKQGEAKSKIARLRVHVFWEAIHLVMILIGVGLSTAIIVKKSIGTDEKPIKVEIVERKR
jgi:hypothetical protein